MAVCMGVLQSTDWATVSLFNHSDKQREREREREPELHREGGRKGERDRDRQRADAGQAQRPAARAQRGDRGAKRLTTQKQHAAEGAPTSLSLAQSVYLTDPLSVCLPGLLCLPVSSFVSPCVLSRRPSRSGSRTRTPRSARSPPSSNTCAARPLPATATATASASASVYAFVSLLLRSNCLCTHSTQSSLPLPPSPSLTHSLSISGSLSHCLAVLVSLCLRRRSGGRTSSRRIQASPSARSAN